MIQSAPPTLTPSLPARSNIWLSLLLLVSLAGASLANAWPLLALRSNGQTSVYFEKQAALGARPAIAWPKANQSLDSVDITIWFLPTQETFYAQDIFAKRLERGQTADGQVAYFIDFDEASLTQYLNYWFANWAARYVNFRNAQVALKPSGLIIYGDVDLGTHWQRVGAVFNLDESGRQFNFVGVDIDGQLMSIPPAGPIATAAMALTVNGNRALQDLKFIDPAGTLSIQQIVLTEDGAQIVVH
jgi:hypothetical protein